MKKALFILISILAFNFITYCQLDRSIEPKVGPAFKMALPKIERAELENGLRIIAVEHKELPVIQIQMVIRTGADADVFEKAGVASLTSEMLDEGTTTRNALQIADDLDFIGAAVTTSANYDGSYVGLLTLKEHLKTSFEIFSDVILNPVFPDSDFDRIKDELLTDLIAQKVRSEIVASNVFNLKLFGEQHPYSQNIDGSDETVHTITVQNVKDYYNQFYVPNNASLIVVGDITMKEAMQLAKNYFGNWQKKLIEAPVLPEVGKSQETKFYIVNKEDAPQSQIRIGNIGIRRNSPDFYAVNILNQIIGASNGRLFLNLRETHAYTYGAYANFSMRKAEGPFLAYAGVKTDVTDSSIIEFLNEINRIRDELVPEDEFEMYKTAVIQRLPRVFETPAQITSQILGLELFNLPDDYFSMLMDNYQKVTREDIQRVAQNYLQPRNLTIVVVGDSKNIRDKIEKLGYGKIILCDEKGKEH